ncbi:MAG: hypothetical protein L3K15_07675 [Thermoplasmata archaeon]|nr:hypothetical protein [Thermoplasmata archaeon]
MPENCAECGAPFGSAADLVEHAKKAHAVATMPNAPPAPPADPEFSSVDLIAEPESTPRFACVFCASSFATPQELAAHNRSAHLAPPEGVAEAT